MSTQYRCGTERRRQAVREAPPANGIDYLEVAADQRTLFVRLLRAAPAGALRPGNVVIEGGVRVRDIRATAVLEVGEALVVVVDRPGDFSTYRLRLVTSPTVPAPPANFDPLLSEIAFSFKVDCPGDFDCATDDSRPADTPPAPAIDYLARDYASFRRLMLDRLAVVMPDWRERHPADLGVALVETLAAAADHLSYFQDAVATEAYLGTARRRVSVRRHARLLDYPMHDGCNARAWVQVQVDSTADGLPLRRLDDNGRPTRFLTRCPEPVVLRQDRWEAAFARHAPEVFEPLHDATLYQAHNAIRFYTWGDEECCLPAGTTRATLRRRNADGRIERLGPGDLLLFEEVRGPASGLPEDADPTHRHVVRLTEIRPAVDPLFPEPGDAAQRLGVVEIAWGPEDALPFPLCLSATVDGALIADISLARGNVVLVDHGRTVVEQLPPIPEGRRYRPALRLGPVAWQGQVADRRGDLVPFDPQAPAAAATRWAMRGVRPAIALTEPGNESQPWLPQRDLLGSDRFATEFVVETEDDGRAFLRFGVPPLGRVPASAPRALYRVGNGRAGLVGAGAIAHIVTDLGGVRAAGGAVRNPLPAAGGADPEPVEQVRLYAPQAFRAQERAVTEADYAAAAEGHPEVQKAAATRRWTGSWHTMFVTIDRARGLPVDAAFEDDLRRYLERFRLAGYDLEIAGPTFVPLDLALRVCVAPGYSRGIVRAALLETFGNGERPGGAGRGFFHPDNFTFGQPVFLSQVIAAAMGVPGVTWVDVERFGRWGQEARGERAAGRIAFGRLEIARLDNDPNRGENGRIEFIMQGGL